jgi:hypothetical protein
VNTRHIYRHAVVVGGIIILIAALLPVLAGFDVSPPPLPSGPVAMPPQPRKASSFCGTESIKAYSALPRDFGKRKSARPPQRSRPPNGKEAIQ